MKDKTRVEITCPDEFSFELCLQFLRRSPREVLHRVDGDRVLKLIRINEEIVLFSIYQKGQKLVIEFLNGVTSPATRECVKTYVKEWFDLDTNLKPFYALARKDELLKGLVKKYHGYRIVGQPDLFESLVWAVLGQQINLQFAYTLKQRFVETFGESKEWDQRKYYLFPSPERVIHIKPEQLLALQFSRQKAAYSIGIAQAFAEGRVYKEMLRGVPLLQGKEELMKIKGIGNWTANYALMKTFRYPDAFPLQDAGLHNALKNLMNLKSKPSLDRIKKIFKKYKGWEAYATLYLWKSL